MNADKCSTSSTPIVLFKSGWLSGEKILRIVLLASALAKRTIQIFFPHTARYRTASRASLERSGNPSLSGGGGGCERKRGRKGQRAASSLGELGVLGRLGCFLVPNMPNNAPYAYLSASELLVLGRWRNSERIWGGWNSRFFAREELGAHFGVAETPKSLAHKKLPVCHRETSCLSVAVVLFRNSPLPRSPFMPNQPFRLFSELARFFGCVATQIVLLLTYVYI